jgi:hypothetical protein
MLHARTPIFSQAIHTITPQPEVIKSIYNHDFTQTERNLFMKECKSLFKQDAVAATVLLRPGVQDIIMYHVGENLHARWLELSKVEAEIILETSEDFLILQYLLNKRTALIQLNHKFNEFVLARARVALAQQSLDDPAKEVSKWSLFSTLLLNQIIHSFDAAKDFFKSFMNLINDRGLILTLFFMTSIVTGLMGGLKLGAMLGSIIPGVGTVVGTAVGGALGSGIGAWLVERSFTLFYARFFSEEGQPEAVPALELKEWNRVSIPKPAPDTSRIYHMLTAAKNRKDGLRPFFDREQGLEDKQYLGLLQSIKNNPVVNEYGVCFNNSIHRVLIWSKNDTWEHFSPEDDQAAESDKPSILCK